MKPERILSLIGGAALILVGAVGLVGNVFLGANIWRLWPVIVLLVGAGLTLPGFLAFKNAGYGSFFIPGIPVLTTGIILLVTSLTQHWELWAVLWPIEVLGLALAFALAAVAMRVPALAIPAMIIGFNGALFLFCAVTGLWQAWAVLWPIEPLSVGLGLLVLGIVTRARGTNTAGLILCGIAGGGFFIMSFINVFQSTLLNAVVPGMLVLIGLLVAGMAFFRYDAPKVEAMPVEAAPESAPSDVTI